MKNPLRHYHTWSEIVIGHGLAAKLRICKCGYQETFLFDRTKHAFVWTPGNFLEDYTSHIFVVAGTYETWLKSVQFLNDTFKDTEVRRIEGEYDLNEMLKLIVPRIYLTEDWFESDLISNPKLRVILMYR